MSDPRKGTAQGFHLEREDQLPELVKLTTELFKLHGALRIRFAKATKAHTRLQQNLFWRWCERLHKHFHKTDTCTAEEKYEMHDILCHLFLGYDVKIVGRTQIGPSLVTLTWPHDLPTGKMTRFMRQIEVWAIDHGCMLPVPEDNEYAKLRESV